MKILLMFLLISSAAFGQADTKECFQGTDVDQGPPLHYLKVIPCDQVPEFKRSSDWSIPPPKTVHWYSLPKDKSVPRGKKKLLLYLPVVGFAVASDWADIRNSSAAFKLGYVEGNDWLVGRKPTELQLAARDGLELALSTTPSVLMYKLRNAPLFYGFMSGPVVFGIKHIQGAIAGYKDLHPAEQP